MVLKELLSILLWGGAAVGYLWSPLKLIERVYVTIAALMLVVAIPLTDQIGFGMAALFFAWHIWQKRKVPAVAA